MPWAEDKKRLESMTEEQREEYYRRRAETQRNSYYNAPDRRARMDRKNELRRQKRAAEKAKQERREREAENRPSRSKHGAPALDAWLREGEQIRGYSAFLQSREAAIAAQLNVGIKLEKDKAA